MEKFSELKHHLDKASKSLAQLETSIQYFQSNLNKDFLLSVGSVHFMLQYAGSIQVNGRHYQAIASKGSVKGVAKQGDYWAVHADLFGHTVTALLTDDECEQFLEACKNSN